MDGRGIILVEGHGELGAVDNLVARLWAHRGPPWRPAARWPSLHTVEGRRKALERYRGERPGGVLLLRDEDDACPAVTGPMIAAEIGELDLPFPVAVVLFKPEFEVIFLPCIEQLRGRPIRGRPGLRADAAWPHDSWEARRGVKEWLGAQFPLGKSYKPTMDQEALTRMLDLDQVRRANVPCFGTLERALAFLEEAWCVRGPVYPPSLPA